MEWEAITLCATVSTILKEQGAFVEVVAPVKICGDVHGQLDDLLRLFDRGGWPSETNQCVFAFNPHQIRSASTTHTHTHTHTHTRVQLHKCNECDVRASREEMKTALVILSIVDVREAWCVNA